MSETPAPDPALVRYLRNNLKRFGAEALRGKLTEEGVAPEDIDAALAEAERRSNPRRFLTPLFVLGGSALTLLGVAIWFSGPAHRPPPPPPPLAAAPAGASDASQAGDSGRPFVGHSGYILQIPPRYSALSEFKDPQKSVEIVFIFPAGTDPTNLGNEGIYSQLGILRLEVSPRRIPEGRIAMESVRAGVVRTLQNQKSSFTTREGTVGGFPSLVVNIGQPFPLAQAFILGSKEMYVLTGGSEDAAFSSVMESLREASQ